MVLGQEITRDVHMCIQTSCKSILTTWMSDHDGQKCTGSSLNNVVPFYASVVLLVLIIADI